MSVGDVNSAARGSGARYNDGKVPLELVPLRVLATAWYRAGMSDPQTRAVAALFDLAEWQEGGPVSALFAAADSAGASYDDCARVFDYGRRKYASWNWSKGMAWSIPLGCAARHLQKIILQSETHDPESGLPHLGHFLCNVVMLITFARTYAEGDDRPTTLAIPVEPPVSRTVRTFGTRAAPGPIPAIVPIITPLVRPIPEEEQHDG